MVNMSNKGVVLFKASKEDGKDLYVDLFQQNGLCARCIPVLRFDFLNLDILHAALLQPENYSGIIFTSQRAVEAVEKAIQMVGSEEDWTKDLSKKWAKLPAFVVGEATAAAAACLSFTTIGENTGSAESLVPIIREAVKKGDRTLLFPCGNLRRETLPQKLADEGINLNSITVYNTIADPNIQETLLQYIQEQGEPGFLVFYSPSGVQFVDPVLKDINFDSTTTKLIAIGPTTQQALVKHGYAVAATAHKPTPHCLLSCVMELIGH